MNSFSPHSQIVDPEFAFYGPIGFDLGKNSVFISNLDDNIQKDTQN